MLDPYITVFGINIGSMDSNGMRGAALFELAAYAKVVTDAIGIVGHTMMAVGKAFLARIVGIAFLLDEAVLRQDELISGKFSVAPSR